MEIILNKYNQIGYSRAAFSSLLRDISIAKKNKNKQEISILTNTAKHLSNLFIPLTGKIEKEFYRSYGKAFRDMVDRKMEMQYALAEAETFCFPALDFGISFIFQSGFDIFNGSFVSVSASVFENLDSYVLYYRALSQPKRRIIKHFLRKGLQPFIFSNPSTGSLEDFHLSADGSDQLEKYLES